MSQISIRAQEPQDLPQISDLLNQPRAVWGTLQLPFTSLAARQKRFEAGPERTALVTVVEGRVIGQAGLARLENRRSHVGTIGMAVHDDFAGRGAGSALLGALVELADRWLNLTRIELTVWTDNPRAIALYERFGFEPEGVARAYAWRDGAYADALHMARLRP